MYGIAMQGSIPHGEFFMKLVTGHFTRHLAPDAGDPGVNPATVQVIQNYLVPRPEYPKVQEPTKPVTPAMLAEIPTVAVR